MSITVSRRRFLQSVGAGGLSLAVGADGAAPPKETGLSHEGLLVGRPGFQPRTIMPLPKAELPGFLSTAQLAEHHAEYARLVERLHAAERALRQGEADATKYAELRRTQVGAANGVLLHELYFGNLSPSKVEPPPYIAGHVEEHMGPWESWVDDFRQCALTAKAWAVLVYDAYDDRWHDAIMDSDDDGVWLGANPLVVCDVSAHAFGADYRDREAYVDAFLGHIDWSEVAKRYRAVDRM
jgi:Fe-Mn family superoxide dismutase